MGLPPGKGGRKAETHAGSPYGMGLPPGKGGRKAETHAGSPYGMGLPTPGAQNPCRSPHRHVRNPLIGQ